MAESDLRKNRMMAHLLDALDDRQDIGHYGRLVFAIVARHFLTTDELIAWLDNDPDMDQNQAKALVHQVEERDYSPPGASTIRGYDEQQTFSILVDPDDPDAGNVYQDLDFPEHVYEQIAAYHADKAGA